MAWEDKGKPTGKEKKEKGLVWMEQKVANSCGAEYLCL